VARQSRVHVSCRVFTAAAHIAPSRAHQSWNDQPPPADAPRSTSLPRLRPISTSYACWMSTKRLASVAPPTSGWCLQESKPNNSETSCLTAQECPGLLVAGSMYVPGPRQGALQLSCRDRTGVRLCTNPAGPCTPKPCLHPKRDQAQERHPHGLQSCYPRACPHLSASLRYARLIVFSSADSGTSSTRHGLAPHTAPCACAHSPQGSPGVAAASAVLNAGSPGYAHRTLSQREHLCVVARGCSDRK